MGIMGGSRRGGRRKGGEWRKMYSSIKTILKGVEDIEPQGVKLNDV